MRHRWLEFVSTYPFARLRLSQLSARFPFLSGEDNWKSILRDSSQEFMTSYSSATQSLANLLQRFTASLSLDFIQKIPDDVLLYILHGALSDDIDPDVEEDATPSHHCHPSDAIRLSMFPDASIDSLRRMLRFGTGYRIVSGPANSSKFVPSEARRGVCTLASPFLR